MLFWLADIAFDLKKTSNVWQQTFSNLAYPSLDARLVPLNVGKLSSKAYEIDDRFKTLCGL